MLWCRLARISGVSGAYGSAGSSLPGRCMGSSGRGGKVGTQTGRTPFLPVCLPERVPMTFCDREPAGMVRRGAHPLSVGPRSVTVDSAAHLVFRAPERGRRAAPSKGATPRYRAGHHPLPGGSTRVEGPLYRAGSGRAPVFGVPACCQQASTSPSTRESRGFVLASTTCTGFALAWHLLHRTGVRAHGTLPLARRSAIAVGSMVNRT